MFHHRSYQLCFLLAVLLLACGSAFAQEQKGTSSSLPEFVPAPLGDGVMLSHAKESFSTLSLEGSELTPRQPLSGGKAERKSFVRELFQVQWRPNDPIDLYVIRPRDVKRPPVVLYLYGFPSDTERFKDERYCERLVRAGAAAVGFVSALTGHRDEHRPPNEWFIGQLQESLATTVHDVQMILNYLDSRGDLDMSRVGMFGQGSGGTIAILAAAADPRLKALDLLDPWGDWPTWLAKSPMVPPQERGNFLAADFLKRLEPLEPVRFLPDLKSRKIRMQFVDEYGAPKEAVSKLATATPSGAVVLHYPTSMEFRDAVAGGRLFEWISSALQAKSDPPEHPAPKAEKTTVQSK
jgi:acetyl esterase/lipase